MNLSNPNNLLIAGIYFILVGIMSLFSLFGVYILIRYGRSVPFSITLSVLYVFFFLTILFQSYHNLSLLLV
jgi:hypothetical protein